MRRKVKRKPRKKRAFHRQQGQKEGFELEEVQTIDKHLEEQDELFDRTLFHVAIDTMLRSSDLLALTWEDVSYSSGGIKSKFVIYQKKTGHKVTVYLMKSTQQLLEQFIKKYSKTRKSRLFDYKDGVKVTGNWYRRFVKRLAKSAGIVEIEKYSGHSTRRTKAMYLYRSGQKMCPVGKCA